MHCGKKWWIREFVAPYIFPLNPDYVAARSLRSLRSNNNNNNNSNPRVVLIILYGGGIINWTIDGEIKKDGQED